ncbi:MAG: SdiA-regulated domain-containing protein [Bacteroidales bacterium]
MTRHLLLFVLLISIAISCKKDNPSDSSLKQIASYNVNLAECSGLSKYLNDNFLTVSDTLEKVYVIDKTGNVLDSLSYEGQNPEGVVYDSKSGHVLVVEENTNEVVELDGSGEELSRFTVTVNNIYVKHGLEGITLNPENDHFYLVSEKSPGLLFEFTRDGQELNRHTLSFAKDYSSVFYDESLKKLWILSDDSGTVTRCSLSGGAEQTWTTGINKGEGLIVESSSKRIYIISDSDQKLYVFSY